VQVQRENSFVDCIAALKNCIAAKFRKVEGKLELQVSGNIVETYQ
jgi:hypothetical protein